MFDGKLLLELLKFAKDHPELVRLILELIRKGDE